MTQSEKPIILFTNDDGIESPGLWAAVAAFRDVGRLLVVAPREQQSGMGRSMPHASEGRIYPYERRLIAAIAAPTRLMARRRRLFSTRYWNWRKKSLPCWYPASTTARTRATA